MQSGLNLRPKRFARRLILAVAVVAAVSVLYLVALQWTGNFHTLVAGEVYRSGQPSSRSIAAYSKTYGIRTILNLRGESKESWYRDEAAAAQRNGIRLINFPMSSSSAISLQETRALMAILRDAPKPLLIHCKAGADRTGLVSTIYLQQIAGVDEETAEWQLSPIYGHVALPYFSSTFAMDETWEALEKSFGLDS
ncbi:dual specificity protein phosphatase family protein [Ensifer sp. HO-A22]|uniref:Dual specificity protein phosphatase family protein n=1 Tax=Ensifer oleiphilus TaxID=2742698 RepID=A0A7Y6Q1N9_9HYPH|nr:dual specificity protein phosphatase family protein [Ensifer oleiphilus]NVD37434.1 dual specificity protein phosphatase family protein [Ensifer oleiphilus]